MEGLGARDPPLSVRSSRSLFQIAVIVSALLALVAVRVSGQGNSLTLLTREGRRSLPISTINGQEMIALEELASLFQLQVRDERDAITVSYRGRTIVLTPDQTVASVAGRVISLPAPPARTGGRWQVPLDFIARAIAPIHDTRIELRRPSHLLLVGDVRVPRVSVREELVGNAARVTVEITPRASATVAQEAQRLAIHVDADAIEPTLPAGGVAGFVQGLRAVDATTIAIDLGPRFASFRSTSQTLDASTRVTIDLLPAASEPAPAAPAAPPAPAPNTTQIDAPLPELPTIGVGSGWIRTVAIDAGHGGEDAGVKGPGGSLEKTVTLAVARRLKSAIESRLGLRVIMTREDDHQVAVADRAALANNNKADLFVSLHANASFRPSVAGATVYVAAFSEGTRDERTAAPERLPAFGGGFRDLELVPWNLAQRRHKDQSDAFANLILQQFKDKVPLAGPGLDHGPLRVLEPANMPAVLVELGYLTNADQEKKLSDNDFQGVIAQSLLEAIIRFRDVGSQTEGGGPR